MAPDRRQQVADDSPVVVDLRLVPEPETVSFRTRWQVVGWNARVPVM